MGYYSNTIYPWLLDNSEPKEMPSLRKVNLKDVKAEILEIGIGTGANLSFYPKQIGKLTVIEPLDAMYRRAQKKAIDNHISIEWFRAKGEKLPFSDNSFDSVVSTGLLCTVEDVSQVLSEIHRVLKPRGNYFFLEHGLSKNDRIQRFQRMFNGMNEIIACGCNLTRDIEDLIDKSLFENTIYYPVEPLSGIGVLYEPIRGVAKK